jgi:hypothetical protein
MGTNRIFGRSSLGGMGWRGTESSPPGRFQTRGTASPESLSRGAILEHCPGGTRPTILKLLPTRHATRKRPWTTWLTRKLLWTLGIRRRGREREPHNTARGCHESHQDDNNRNLPLSRIRDSAMASVVELVCGRLSHACPPTLMSQSPLLALAPRKEDALGDARQSIDRILSEPVSRIWG